MPTLPKRPGPYLLTLLLILLGILTFWMQHVLTNPSIQRAVLETKAARDKEQQASPPSSPPLTR